MPKTGRPTARSLVAISAVAMVPRQHAAPLSLSGHDDALAPTRPFSGRARSLLLGDRATVAALAFLLGFAACYLVLRPTVVPLPVPPAGAAVPHGERALPKP